jgi:hypothetical protein
MSGLDFVVHRVLYNYGLQFSYGWASFYWLVFGSVFAVFSFAVGLVYWLASNRMPRDLRVSAGLTLSIFLLSLGGLEDVLWFVLWNGSFPDVGVIWWWMPWFGIFGFWNGVCQLILISIACLFVCVFWAWALHSRGSG